MSADHRGKRRWRKPPEPTNTYAEAEKRVRRQDRRHKCHERCECVRTAAVSTTRGCCSGSGILLLGVLAAIVIAIMAATGKL